MKSEFAEDPEVGHLGTGVFDAALDYARRGWAVLPLHRPQNDSCSCRKATCVKSGKHPRSRNGVKDASTDEVKIRDWSAKWPDANIGIATGSESGLFVLDVDDRYDSAGSHSLTQLEEQNGPLPSTLTCTTGTGRHIYFRHPGLNVKNSAGILGAGLDVRADGGYVVAPPSLHASGKTYRWVDPSAAIADLPDWLLKLLSAASASANLIHVGSRNDGLTRIAGSLRACGMEREGIEKALFEANATKLEAPLPLAEVRGIAASVSRYPAGHLNLPWFQFYPTDWFATNVVRLGRDYQVGWYIQLLAECWRRGGVLPADPDMLWRWAGAESDEAFHRNGDGLLVLREFELVKLNDGAEVLWHPWMADHYQKQAKAYRQKCEASAIAAARRKGRTPNMALDEGEASYESLTDRTTDRSPN